MTDSTPAQRKLPRQPRGQKRVEVVLDAAQHLFASRGYDATTTNAIAQTAGISIGSLYQFFSNKEEILHALIQRYETEFIAIFDAALTHNPPLMSASMERVLGKMFRDIGAFYARYPAFKSIFYEQVSEDSGTSHRLFVRLCERTASILHVLNPDLSPSVALQRGTILISAMKAVMPLGLNAEGTPNEAMMGELWYFALSNFRAMAELTPPPPPR